MPRQRKASGDLVHALDASCRPIYLLDDRQTIQFCNAACAAWTGIAAEQLVGQACRYCAPADERSPAAAAARLCPAPEAFEGCLGSGLVSAISAAGQVVFRQAEFLPLADSASPGFLLVILGHADVDDSGDRAPADAESTAEQLHAELVRLRHRFAGRYALDRLLGPSSGTARVRAQVQLAAAAPASVLIVGPPGSGKEHIAKAIHYRQPLDTLGSLVPLSAAALDSELFLSTLESLLARSAAARADLPGTLLLEDVDQLALEVQPQLIKLLESGSVPRLISTACQPLAELAVGAQFNADLAALLSTLTIELLPLERRLEDLPLLAQMFLEEINAEGDRQISGFSPEALDRLAGYSWPGNLDELAKMVRQMHAEAAGSTIAPRDLPKRIQLAADAALWSRRPEEPIDLTKTLERLETELINRALARAKGNKSRAAELLGLTRPRLYRRLVQLGLDSAEEVVEFEELE
jgi:DNA-binding NtrC family response regulator